MPSSWRMSMLVAGLGAVLAVGAPAALAADPPPVPGPAITVPGLVLPKPGSTVPSPSPASLPGTTPAGQQAPPVVQQTIQQTTVDFQWTDAASWADTVFTQVLVTALRQVGNAVLGVVDRLVTTASILDHTPPALTYGNGTVQRLQGDLRAAALAALAVLGAWGGMAVMARDALQTPYHEALALLPRLVVGAVLVGLSPWICRLGVDLGNGLCAVVGGAALPGTDPSLAASQALPDLLAFLVYAVMALLLVLQLLMRLALVDLLIVVAPVALICWVLPQTHGWMGRWSSLYVAAVLTQFVQVAALHLGTGLIAGLGGGGLLGLCLGVAVLVLTLKVPGLLGSIGAPTPIGMATRLARLARGGA